MTYRTLFDLPSEEEEEDEENEGEEYCTRIEKHKQVVEAAAPEVVYKIPVKERTSLRIEEIRETEVIKFQEKNSIL